MGCGGNWSGVRWEWGVHDPYTPPSRVTGDNNFAVITALDVVCGGGVCGCVVYGAMVCYVVVG